MEMVSADYKANTNGLVCIVDAALPFEGDLRDARKCN